LDGGESQVIGDASFQIIPLKTLKTRMMDLIHKQIRKPLESLSHYFRYTQ
jgi:hypothetical protein